MQWILIPFGIIFSIALSMAILVPYLRGRRDLITAWNLFLLGSVNFIGITAIQSGRVEYHLYGMFGDIEYVRFVVGAIVFYGVAFFTYRFFKWPEKLGATRLRKWAPRTTGVLTGVLIFSAIMVLGYLFVPQVQFLGQISYNVGLAASVFAVVFAYMAWYQRPWNPVLLTLMVTAVLSGVIIALSSGFGRRALLNAVLAVFICHYWVSLRYQSAGKALRWVVVGAAVTAIFVGAYSVLRHEEADRYKSSVEVAVERLLAIPRSFGGVSTATNLLGGDTTEASLAAIQLYTETARPQPFFTIYYILTNPVPRVWWPEKPRALGETLPEDIGYVSRIGTYINLGPGVVGHGYHEGGLAMLAVYGFAFASVFRFFDSLMSHQTDNPFLIGILAAASGNIVALPRGDFGVFIMLILAAVVTGMLINFFARMAAGSADYGRHPEMETESSADGLSPQEAQQYAPWKS